MQKHKLLGKSALYWLQNHWSDGVNSLLIAGEKKPKILRIAMYDMWLLTDPYFHLGVILHIYYLHDVAMM